MRRVAWSDGLEGFGENMTTRKIKCKEVADVEPCPKCGNKTEFMIHSDYCAEDCCEVWAVCKCGHETSSGDRFEDVWGGCDDNNCVIAMSCWNAAIRTTEHGKAEDSFNAAQAEAGGMPYGTYGGY